MDKYDFINNTPKFAILNWAEAEGLDITDPDDPKKLIEDWAEICADHRLKTASAPELLAENERLKVDKAELLEALESALSGLEYCIEFTSLPFSARSKKLEPIRAAIARAKGEA